MLAMPAAAISHNGIGLPLSLSQIILICKHELAITPIHGTSGNRTPPRTGSTNWIVVASSQKSRPASLNDRAATPSQGFTQGLVAAAVALVLGAALYAVMVWRWPLRAR